MIKLFARIFNKKNNKGVKQMATIEEIKKAYHDLTDEDKKKFDQTYKDRVDESVGEQEKETKTEDSQTAKDRVDESEAMEKSSTTNEESEDKSPNAKAEDKGVSAGEEKILEMLKSMNDRIEVIEKKATEDLAVDDKANAKEQSDLQKLVNQYEN